MDEVSWSQARGIILSHLVWVRVESEIQGISDRCLSRGRDGVAWLRVGEKSRLDCPC
jgi:hypothetical protein